MPGARRYTLRSSIIEFYNQERTAYPSRRQDATKIASASASLSINHSPGRSGWWRGDMSTSLLTAAGSDAARTPAPNTRMTTSCARELISFARRTRWTSASDLVRRARCKAERRYSSDDDELWEVSTKSDSGNAGNWEVWGSVCTSDPGAALRAEMKEEGKYSVWRTFETLCVSRASGMVGGGTDHIRSAGWASGMKSVMTGSDLMEGAVKSAKEEGTEQPVR
jgi:hypothetical protein